MSTKVEIRLIVGSTYEVLGSDGSRVRFKFVHANNLNSGKIAVEINGTMSEIDSVLNLVAPANPVGIVPIDVKTTF